MRYIGKKYFTPQKSHIFKMFDIETKVYQKVVQMWEKAFPIIQDLFPNPAFQCTAFAGHPRPPPIIP
jgi:hypothetical protein